MNIQRAILPIVAGAALGALVVTLLLTGESADDSSAAAIAGAERAAESTTGASAEPDSGGPEPAVSLDELSSIADPAARREAALALLAVHGHDTGGIERVAASLPPTEAVNFRIHAIVDLGTRDLRAAVAAAMTLPEHEQRRLALLRLAPVLAATDPPAAMGAAEEIDSPELELEFVAALLDAWTVLDPASVFDHLELADLARIPATDIAFDALAASDPERLLAMAGNFRRDIENLATTAALESLIERDPDSALAHLEALPPGSDRSRLELSVAEIYGEQDPEAAWQWATDAELDALARIGVVSGIQKVDPDMAWDIMLSQLNSADDRVRTGTQEYLMNYVNAVVNSESPDDIVTGLDRLLGLDDPRIDAEMQTNIQAWANRDPEAALDWSLANLDRVDSARLLTSLSAGLARTNLDLARQTIYRLDEARRTSWAAGVARTLAEYDLAAARSWAYELPSGPLRDAGLHELIRGEAQGGSVDRQLFAQFSSDRARGQAAASAARRFACDGRTALALEIARAHIAERQTLDNIVGQIEGNAAGGSSLSPFMCQFAQ